jgi:hypothetical protein
LTLKTVQGTSPLEDGESPFPVIPRRFIRTRETPEQTQLVKTKIKSVFRPNIAPFTDSDQLDDFPMAELLRHSSRRPTNYESYTDDYEAAFGMFEEEEEAKSLLIDLRDQDIFWTSDNVPFTRGEVEMMKKFREQCRAHSELHNTRTKRVLDERDETIARTFQSSLAFSKEIELVNKAKERAQKLPPGKGVMHELSWKIAAKEAEKDPSGLPYRKKSWAKFVRYVSAIGPLKSASEKKLVQKFRELLIEGTPVGKDCFFTSICDLEKGDFALLRTTMIIEVMRIVCSVSTEELLSWMKEENISDEIMRAAPEAIKRIKRARIRNLREQEKLLSQAKIMRGDIPKLSLEKGLPMFRKQFKKQKNLKKG